MVEFLKKGMESLKKESQKDFHEFSWGKQWKVFKEFLKGFLDISGRTSKGNSGGICEEFQGGISEVFHGR